MAFDKQFGNRLREGLASVSLRQNISKAEVEQRVATETGFSFHTIKRWQRGYIPTQLEQVSFLVRYCVAHGRVGRDWAESLLTHANYPHRSALLQEIFPESNVVAEPELRRPLNLPTRRGNFLGRRSELEWVLDALDSGWPVCSLEGMGGVGKTTLALEVAYACVGQPRGMAVDFLWPKFDFIIWTSAVPEEGNLTLNDVLDTIARRLNYPALTLTQKPLDEKRELVNDLLAQQPVLLIVDNFETITDPEIASFLVKVPSATKVLLTSREEEQLLAPTFRRYPPARIHLSGLPDVEALMYLRQEARRMINHRRETERSRLEAVMVADDTVLLTLVKATGGNPKALGLALGYIADSATPLKNLVDNLYAASDSVAKLLDYFFHSAWEKCSEGTRDLWRVMLFFAGPARREALATAAGLRGRYFYDALEELTGRFLVDVEDWSDGEPSYYTHPLVHAFAVAQLRETPAFEAEARERWLGWYKDFLARYREEDWPVFAVLDTEYDNVIAAINWSLANHSLHAPLFVRYFWRFLYVRGYWGQCIRYLREAMEQATIQGNVFLRLWMASHLGWLLIERGQMEEALQLLHQVEVEIMSMDQPALLEETDVLNYLGQAYLWLRDLNRANSYQTQFLELAEQVEDRRSALTAHYYIALIKTRLKHYDTAAEDFQELVEEAQALGWDRAKGYCSFRLAEALIYLNKLSEATQWLDRSSEMANFWQEPLLQAHTLLGYAEIQKAHKQLDEAKSLAQSALDLYERLEAQREADNVITFLTDLERESSF